MEWSIQEVARLAGVSSRTLRHYDAVGLLPPSRTGHSGLRYYDADAVRRLQRILLLRQLGLGLDDVGRVLREQADVADALTGHLEQLRGDRRRLDRQIASVERTLAALETGEELMADDMLDGFDHTQHREEVEQRWGREAYARSDAWWRSLGADRQKEWMGRVKELNAAWVAAVEAGVAPDSDEAQALAGRHVDWLSSIPGTPGSVEGRATDEYVLGLGDLYVSDPRFAANYGGEAGAVLVRDSLRLWLERHAG
ncbi:transcriptional regulator, MerR family [Xylanimonas cellulosilytica DSM 15894]|uniref:Transcriptional regulator, MerR family n=1 Tax=Xylanimonas cellulosilytica (strain DSM 15894 / JCM 12276 / CECT 5975 / KCTC 9989 / LMG 20990 / NBRC 107835 / XIL07) TaxID=446471 RepID=D1BU10_XYLCX|nr:TipAS antibiotic-recognition domain-containing protein [Xylanimonas cellulosilytica]ACZ29174.1 transcriptional regulator, MerR family [Xylanimonas cellulosilytica DSM 15894]